jgi:hypothetical protein
MIMAIAAIYSVQVSIADATDERLCFTDESRDRAQAAMRPLLHHLRDDGRVVLSCEVQANARLRCVLSETAASSPRLNQVAMAFASELEACPTTPRQVPLTISFRQGSD